MASAHDVASYILKKIHRTTAMKLQKLVYYSQAWALVWNEKPLFRERVEAWANGPVVPELFSALNGTFTGQPSALSTASVDSLSKKRKEGIDRVLDFYASLDPQWLSDLTH